MLRGATRLRGAAAAPAPSGRFLHALRAGGRAAAAPRPRRLRSVSARPWRPARPAAPGRRRATDDARARAPAAAAGEAGGAVERPTNLQLYNHFWICAVPMMGFGLMDNTVMIHAGNAIDCTLGVTFGLTTLAAAACGQICSDAAGVLFGGTLDRAAAALGLPRANLTLPQRRSAATKRVGLAGSLLGVVFGCSLGLFNLYLIDPDTASELKLRHASSEDHRFMFTVDADNTVRDDATLLTVEGPDVAGLLASLAAAICDGGYDMVEARAGAGDAPDTVSDVFVVRARGGGRVPDECVDELARVLLTAAQDPLHAHQIKMENAELQHKLSLAETRVALLEDLLEQAAIRKISAGARGARRRETPEP